MMINDDSLHAIESAIANTEREISALDSCVQAVASHQEIASALEADLAALRTNAAGLDAKVRGTKFTATNSALSLAQSDLRAVQDVLTAQRVKTVAIGKAAANALFDARDQLQAQRKANIAIWLAAQFDWAQIPVTTPGILAGTHSTVLAIEGLSVSGLYYELQHDDDFTIKALRRLGEHWAQLRPLIEAEPDLELSVAPVRVLPIAKPKVAIDGNQLGTLAAPVIAA